MRKWDIVASIKCLLVGMVMVVGLAGCIDLFPHAIEVSQETYDFGVSELPWLFEVWTDNEHVQTLRFTVASNSSWLICEPKYGTSTGPDDRRIVTVTVDRLKLGEGLHEAEITVSAFGMKSKVIAVTAESDGSLLAQQLKVTNVARSFTQPYLLDFTFSLRDQASRPVIAEPAQFELLCLEDGEGISPSETGAHLSRASNKQLKCFLVLDYTASMADPRNGDSDNDGKSDAIEAMENAANFVFLPALTDDALVGVYEFHRDEAPQLVCDLSVDKDYVRTCIDGIWENSAQSYPGTSRCWDAVYKALNGFTGDHQMDESRNVIFLSDGRDESSTHTRNQVVNKAIELGVRVYGIGFGSELDVTALQMVTSQTHGDFYPADTAADMPRMFRNIVSDLEGQYTLRWATLKRGDNAFTPRFFLSVGDLQASYKSPVDYVPAEHEGETLNGALRTVPSQNNTRTTIFLRSVYVPRYISAIRMYVRSRYGCEIALVSAYDGGLCADWQLTIEEDLELGGSWIIIESPDPDNLFGGLTYAVFGPILRFDFDDILAPADPPFEQIYIDNSLYEGGQALTVDDWPNAPPG